MQGLSLKSLKHHVALQPLMAIMAVGMTFVAVYVGRWFFTTTKWLLWIFALVLCLLITTFVIGGLSLSRASTRLRNWAFPKKMLMFCFLDWHPRQPMSTGPRPRTLVTTWATIRPGQDILQETGGRLFKVNICSGNSNGSTPPARTTTRSLLTGLPAGSPSTTGRKKLPSHILIDRV